MNPLASIVRPLHEHSERQLVDRARRQFKGNEQDFSQLLQEYARLAPRERGTFLSRHGLSSNDEASSTGNQLSLAVSEATGLFLHQLALALRPACVLELGSSVGVSTLYFASAMRQLGQGRVIATEFDPWKVEQLLSNLAAANLSEWVDVRHGDVMQILAASSGPVDLVFMDIWATGYMEAFKLLRPLLLQGSVVLADNMFTAAREVEDFRQHLEQDAGLSTTTLDFESGLEFVLVL